ncbi:LPXTG cell wall anchor domain-containing protein [Listeria monocytogenes]|nr:LPXTG cell wall anchor domain-containing protein [Listeria monocytogenes]
MKTNHFLFNVNKNIVGLLLVIGLSIWIGISHGTEVQADTITQPTAINELFPDAALAESIRETLNKTNVTDTVSQSELNQLTLFQADLKGIQSIEGLQYINNLNNLSLVGNQIINISSLSGLTNLEFLNLSSNQISDISELSELSKLRYLTIYSNQISDVSSLAHLTNLEFVNLYNNQISDISNLSNLTNLTYLSLSRNQISDLSSLSSLTKLMSLNLRQNQISDSSALAGLVNLNYLDLANNQISDISKLASLSKLIDLKLTNQQITSPPIMFQNELVIPNIVKDNTGALVSPETISNNGSYMQPNVTWNLASYLNNVSYTFNQSVTIGSIASVFSGTVNQPLQEANIYNVTFDVDGTKTSTTAEASTLITAPTEPTKEGHTFIGWYDAKTGGNKWDFATDKMPANNLTLYAQFSINNYLVTFDVDGKTSNEMVDYQALLMEPAKPTKEGYTFTGWYDAKTGGKKWDFSTDKMPAKHLTLYAQFTKQETPPNDSGKTPEQGSGGTILPHSQDGGVTVIATNSGKSNPSTMNLPKTGDEATVLPIILGFLCIGVAIFLGFRRIQVK